MKKIITISAAIMLLTSCSQRILDFTAISTQNVDLKFQSEKVEVIGKSFGFMGLGASIKDATDNAIKSAGKDYDLLLNGVVKVKQYPFYFGYVVTGTAVKSNTVTPTK